MKKYLYLLLAFVLFATHSCQETIDIEKETEAIKTVIEEETQAFLNKDFDRMAATYVKDETNIRLSSSSNSYSLTVGWDEVEPLFKEYFKNNPEPSTDRYVKDNYKIKVYKENAWVVNDETVYDPEGNVLFKLIGVRILEKQDDTWKIVYISVVNTSSYEEESEGEDEETDAE